MRVLLRSHLKWHTHRDSTRSSKGYSLWAANVLWDVCLCGYSTTCPPSRLLQNFLCVTLWWRRNWGQCICTALCTLGIWGTRMRDAHAWDKRPLLPKFLDQRHVGCKCIWNGAPIGGHSWNASYCPRWVTSPFGSDSKRQKLWNLVDEYSMLTSVLVCPTFAAHVVLSYGLRDTTHFPYHVQ